MSDTSRHVQSQKKARMVQAEEEMYYPSSENKGSVTAQLICAFVFANAIIRFSRDASHYHNESDVSVVATHLRISFPFI